MAADVERRRLLKALAWASTPYLVLGTERVALAAATSEAGDFVGVVGGLLGGRIAISYDGANVLAYVCNGTDADAPTVARWLKGSGAGGSVNITAKGITLAAKIKGDKANGTVTLPDGSSHAFLAGSRTFNQKATGLYRSEETFSGVAYVGGWIVNPNRHLSKAPESPTIRPVAWTPVSPTDPWKPTSPAAGRQIALSDLEDLENEFEDRLRTSGAIINQQTGALLPYAEPNWETLTAEVSGVGTFHLRRCLQAKCS
jgi:hypothetical protein